MVARNITDTVRDKHATRLKAHLDGPRNKAGDRKVIEYSDGTEITTEKTGDGARRADGRLYMKEVRTITRTKTPPGATVSIGYAPGQYERIFGKKA